MEHETCEQCGFDGTPYDDAALLAALRDLPPAWRALLADAGADIRTRPAPAVWSALEYAAHSRDITGIHVLAVEYALTQENATVPPMDTDAMSDEAAAHYDSQDLVDVLDALEREADRLAKLGEDNASAWDRTLTVGESASTVRRMLEHALHDSTHHLADVERGLAQIRGS